MKNAENLSSKVSRIIKDDFTKIRGLQLAGNMKTSEIFKIIGVVYRETNETSTNLFLVYVIRQLEALERNSGR